MCFHLVLHNMCLYDWNFIYFCDTFGFIGFSTVKFTDSEKSIIVKNKNMKNEQPQSSK